MKKNRFIATLYRELDWLQQVIHQVLESFLLQEVQKESWQDIPMPDMTDGESPYASFVKDYDLNNNDRLALSLALAPHLRPELLDIFFGKNQLYDRRFTEFGGVSLPQHSGFLPTGQTLCFLIGAHDPGARSDLLDVISEESRLFKKGILFLTGTEAHLPNLNGVLSIAHQWVAYLQTGIIPETELSQFFPAKRIETMLEWEDIVLSAPVMKQLQEINAWMRHGQTIMEDWGLKRILKPGYRTLFHGMPGTGKTLAATLLGKSAGREVYRIDLSMIISKYIGETEKNLSRVFEMARNKNWILYFDEADALFGKRTEVSSSNESYANQQIAYLLQRIEAYEGVVILASNFKGNMDDAFTRRFQSIVYFDFPGPNERYRLWQNAFSGKCRLDPEVDLRQISEKFELTGGAINNVLRTCAIAAVARGSTMVTKAELMRGIRNEYSKDNKNITL